MRMKEETTTMEPQRRGPSKEPNLTMPQQQSHSAHQPSISPLQQQQQYDYSDSSSVNMNNTQQINCNLDYSSESSSQLVQPIEEKEERWKPKWAPKCNEKDCKYHKELSDISDNKTEEVNLTKIWVDRHKKWGNAYNNNKNMKIYPIKEEDNYCDVHKSNDCKHRKEAFEKLNNLCRYCQLAEWSEKHKMECWFIPNFVKEGKDEPDESLKNETTFVGFRRPV